MTIPAATLEVVSALTDADELLTQLWIKLGSIKESRHQRESAAEIRLKLYLISQHVAAAQEAADALDEE